MPINIIMYCFLHIHILKTYRLIVWDLILFFYY